jgi:hypothetical protein
VARGRERSADARFVLMRRSKRREGYVRQLLESNGVEAGTGAITSFW